MVRTPPEEGWTPPEKNIWTPPEKILRTPLNITIKQELSPSIQLIHWSVVVFFAGFLLVDTHFIRQDSSSWSIT